MYMQRQMYYSTRTSTTITTTATPQVGRHDSIHLSSALNHSLSGW